MNVTSIKTSKQVITTHNSDVLCINYQDVKGLAPCIHEEADTRILLHLEDAVQQGQNKVSIRTVDTDVVVLAITSAQHLNNDIAAHEIARALGPARCVILPMFHAFTGFDTVSYFGGKGYPSILCLGFQTNLTNHRRMAEATGMICDPAI